MTAVLKNEAAGEPPRKSLVRQSLVFSIGTFLGLLASVTRAAVGARYLAPADMGLWLGLQVLVGYTTNLHLGVAMGMFRNVPLLQARGEREKVAAELQTSFIFIMALTGLLALAGLAVGRRLLPAATHVEIALCSAYAAMLLAKTWYVNAFKSQSRFTELSVASAIGSLAALVGVAGIPHHGFVALIGGAVLQNGLELGVLVVRHAVPRLELAWRVLVGQFRLGFLALISNVGAVTITTIDRTVMLRSLGTSSTGLFSIGAQVTLMMPLIISVPLSVLTPVYFEKVGRGEDLFPLATNATRLIAYAFSWVVASALVLLPPAIHLAWPHLDASIPVCQLALIGAYPYVLSGPTWNVFYAQDRLVTQNIITFVMAGIMFGLATLGVHLRHSIEGAEAGAALGMLLYFLSMIFAAFWLLDRNTAEAARFAIETLAPAAYALVVVVVLSVALRSLGESTSVVRAVVSEILLTLAMLPVLHRARTLVRQGRLG